MPFTMFALGRSSFGEFHTILPQSKPSSALPGYRCGGKPDSCPLPLVCSPAIGGGGLFPGRGVAAHEFGFSDDVTFHGVLDALAI